MTGAINIITRTPDEKGISVHGGAQIGNKATQIYDLSLGSSLLDNKLKLRVSGNLESRDREMTDYYSFALGQYLPGTEVPDYTSGSVGEDRFPNPELAKERKGANAFVDYKVNENVNFQLAGGIQDSYTQSVFMEVTASPLTERASRSKYIDFKAQLYGLNVQVSKNGGEQELLAGRAYSHLDFNSTFANAEYDLNIGKLTLRPGFSYQDATYSDLAYSGAENNGYLNGEETISNFGYFLRADFKPTGKLRLIAAVRNDHYNVPDDSYLSYQVVGSYNFSEKHLIRALYSKANRGPFMLDSYVNFKEGNGITSPFVEYLGSKELNLPVMNMVEFGYRGVISPKVSLDLEVFHTVTTDVTSFEPTYLEFDNFGLHLMYEYINLDLKAKQTGATFSLNVAPSSKVQLKAYATVQQTKLVDYDKKLTPVIIDPGNMIFQLPTSERINTTHKQTPSIYGGVTGNFRPVDKFNLFAGVYYLGAHTYRHDYASYDESKGEVDVAGRAVMNLKASYNVYKNNSIFINARNAFNSKGQEFGFADEIGGLYLLGVNLSF